MGTHADQGIRGEGVTRFGLRLWNEALFRYMDTVGHHPGDVTDQVLALHDAKMIFVRWVRFESNEARRP